MNYAEQIEKWRRVDTKHEKKITCWAPFQAIHVNKHGKVKPCPFSMQWPHTDKQVQWSPEYSLKQCWDDPVFEEIRSHMMGGSLHESWCNYCAKQCSAGKPPSSLDYDTVGGTRDLNHEYPKELELELSNTCNYMCDACSPWCSSQWAEKLGVADNPMFKSSFDDPLWREAFIEDLRSFIHQVHRINFTGGEPFAQRVVYDILKMIEEEQSTVTIHFTTNGSVMNGAVKRMAQRPNTHFTVSLDSIDPISYPTIRVNGDLNQVMENIEYLITTCSNRIGASFVITKKNVMDLPSIISWCNEKGIQFSYHILENMGYRDWEKDLKPISVEAENTTYLSDTKKFLVQSRADINMDVEDVDNARKNLTMYYQDLERLK